MKKTEHKPIPPIYVISGGAGASGVQLVNTVLVQFPDSQIPVIIVPHVRQIEGINNILDKAAKTNGIIVHTLVDPKLRTHLNRLAKEQKMSAIDLMGPLIDRLTHVLGERPIGQPGLYRQLHREYFDRVDAIEFSMNHDDGKNLDDLSKAEIVLVGVSRVGKTPLSMYLSVVGWKVANVPYIVGLPLPEELFAMDRARIIGLTIEPERLLNHRKERGRRMGTIEISSYTDPEKVYEEVADAKKVFKKNGFSVIDVTDKPIETSTQELIELITSRFPKS